MLMLIIVVISYLLFNLHDEQPAQFTDIYRWVVDNSKYEYVDPPKIVIVSQCELAHIWHEKSYAGLVERHGKEIADQTAEQYGSEIQGLFIPGQSVIYIGFSEVIAHEMLHYLQEQHDGIVDIDAYYADMWIFKREMEAYQIQEQYCQDSSVWTK